MGGSMVARGMVRSDMVARVLPLIREKGSIVHACRAAGLDRHSWWLWCRDDPALRKATQQALDDGLRDHLDIAQAIGSNLALRALAGDREAEREYLGRYVSPVALKMAAARLDEYKRDTPQGGGTTSVTLNVALAGLMPQPTPAPAPAVTVEQPAAPALSDPAQDDAESA